MPTYSSLLPQLKSFIENPGFSSFDELAVGLHQYQLQQNPGFRKHCAQVEKYDIEHWQQHPALSTDTFKLEPNPTCLAPDERRVTYMTSGTTKDIRGQHYFRSTELYQHSVLHAWNTLGLPKIHKLFILTPPPEQAPHSSLSSMMEMLAQVHAPEAIYLIDRDMLDIAPLIAAAEAGEPVTLLGTALAFLNAFELLGDSTLGFAEGSWAMETGGYKGSGRSLSKEQLYSQFQKHLGLENDAIWNEYSMTELSSQFYTHGIGRPHRAPHWMKIEVLSPETDKAVAPGEIGYLKIYDLANIDSVAGIRTQDLAIYHDPHSFTLIGRDPSALPRGCSRAIDEVLAG